MPTVAEVLQLARESLHTGRFDEVERLCRAVLDTTCNLAEPHALLAEALAQHDAFDEALAHFRQALCLQPDHVPTHLNLGCMLERAGWIDEAIACYRNGLRIAPDLAQAHQNLGRALCEQHRVAEAITCFERALSLEPEWPAPRLGLAHARLMLGDFGRAWDDYECRDAVKSDLGRASGIPRWNGSRSSDTTLLISAEQGLGTEIMFASCLPDVVRDIARVVLECDARLQPLFRRSFPEVSFVAKPTGKNDTPQPSDADSYIPLGSLPSLYRRSEADFPDGSQYLVPDSVLQAAWASRLERLGDGPKIGISWRGGSSTEKMLKRSAPLDQWLPILRIPDIRWVNIQYGPCDGLLRKMADEYGITIHDWNDLDQTRNMEGMAAMLSQLDLIISVPNSAVHLAAAVGSPVWLLHRNRPVTRIGGRAWMGEEAWARKSQAAALDG